MKKKLLLSAAALVLGASNLLGLSAVSAQTELDFTAVETAYGTELWPEIVEAYKEVNPDVTINLTMEKELEDAITPRLQAGDYPDVVLLAQGRAKALTETMIKEQGLVELTDVLDITIPGEEGTVKDKLMAGITDSTSTNPYNDGKTFLMPMFYSPTGLFYNKALFAEKGWEVPATWDEMWELGDKAKEEGIALFTYPTAGYLDTFFSSMLYNVGGQEFFDKATAYDPEVWSSDQMKQVFEILAKLATYTEPTTVANANDTDYVKNQQAILDNKALFMPNGTWVVGEMAEAPRADGFEWGMTALPTAESGQDRYAYTYLEHIWVPAGAENEAAAKDFVAFLYSDKAVEIFAKHGAVQPVKDVAAKLPEDQQLFYNVYSDGVLPAMGGFIATESIEGVSVADSLYRAYDSVVSGDLTVEDWQANVVEVMTQFHELVVQ